MQKKIPVQLPISNIINGVTRHLAVTAINGYQKFISPHKGFSCAHRVLYGCESCSQYFKNVIAKEGMLKAIANAKGRFQECHEANEILKERRAKYKDKRKYYALRDISGVTTTSIESSDPEAPPDDSDIPESPQKPNQKPIGASPWSSKRRALPNNVNNNGNNGNCDYCGNCADGLNVIPRECFDESSCNNPLDALDCPSISCPDMSCPNLSCGNADCLSGMDCSGLDCGGLDCGGFGSCS